MQRPQRGDLGATNTEPARANASEIGSQMQSNLTVPASQAHNSPPLRVKAIACALQVDKATVYREIQSGRLPSYRVGSGRGTIRVSRAAFEQYLADRGIPGSELAVA